MYFNSNIKLNQEVSRTHTGNLPVYRDYKHGR